MSSYDTHIHERLKSIRTLIRQTKGEDAISQIDHLISDLKGIQENPNSVTLIFFKDKSKLKRFPIVTIKKLLSSPRCINLGTMDATWHHFPPESILDVIPKIPEWLPYFSKWQQLDNHYFDPDPLITWINHTGTAMISGHMIHQFIITNYEIPSDTASLIILSLLHFIKQSSSEEDQPYFNKLLDNILIKAQPDPTTLYRATGIVWQKMLTRGIKPRDIEHFKKLARVNRSEIVQNMKESELNIILDEFIANNIFTPMMTEYISSEKNHILKVRAFLDNLTRRGPYMMNAACIKRLQPYFIREEAMENVQNSGFNFVTQHPKR